MIKAAFFDIDGTLLTKRGSIAKSTRQAIERLREKGILCVIATGRGPVNLEQLIDHLPVDGYIVYNGQLVICGEETVYAAPFSSETVKQLAEYGDEHRKRMIFGGRNSYYGSELMNTGQKKFIKKMSRFVPRSIKYLLLNHINFLLNRNSSAKAGYADLPLNEQAIFQAVMMCNEHEQAAIAPLFSDCHLTRSSSYSVDIIPSGGSKLVGIKAFLANHQIDVSEAIAFGDSWNDLEMIEHIGIGVAMGNANQDLKAVADFVTKSHNEDGIYFALKYYNII